MPDRDLRPRPRARASRAAIPANPWQTDTCIGEWHYNREAKYKTPKRVIDMLVDIVSRNGNLMLNFCCRTAALDPQELHVLDEITRWMAVNSEGIYATRPWKMFGEGPVAPAPPATGGRGAGFNECSRHDFTAEEIRFTTVQLPEQKPTDHAIALKYSAPNEPE